MEKGWRLGLLKGEGNTEEGLKIGLTRGKRGNGKKLKNLLNKRWKKHWRKGEDWAYQREKGAWNKGLIFCFTKRWQKHKSAIKAKIFSFAQFLLSAELALQKFSSFAFGRNSVGRFLFTRGAHVGLQLAEWPLWHFNFTYHKKFTHCQDNPPSQYLKFRSRRALRQEHEHFLEINPKAEHFSCGKCRQIFWQKGYVSAELVFFRHNLVTDISFISAKIDLFWQKSGYLRWNMFFWFLLALLVTLAFGWNRPFQNLLFRFWPKPFWLTCSISTLSSRCSLVSFVTEICTTCMLNSY